MATRAWRAAGLTAVVGILLIPLALVMDGAPAAASSPAPCALCVLGPTGNTVNGSGTSAIDVTDSGTGSAMPGIVVNSSSGDGASTSCTGQAAELSGNAVVNAPNTEIVGGWCQVAGASFVPAPTRIPAPGVADPLASLPTPTTAGTPTAVNISGSSCATQTVQIGGSMTTGAAVIGPGVYSGIDVSGSGTCLTLTPGIYVITGMFDISGASSVVTGTGVLLYFTCSTAGSPSACPNGGSGGWLNDSGSATQLDLSPSTTCPYAGLTVFYDRNNTEPIQLSGTATDAMINGTIYGVSSQLVPSGTNLSLGSWVIVGSIAPISGNAVLDIAYNPANNASATCGSTGGGGSTGPGGGGSTGPGGGSPTGSTGSSGGSSPEASTASATAALAPAAGASSTPIAGATTVHTGEPWAGSEPLEIALLGLGIGAVVLGDRRRRAARRS